MANVLISQEAGGDAWKTHNATTIANGESNTSDAIPCSQYTYYNLIAWAAGNMATSIEISHDGTTYKELDGAVAATTIVESGVLNANYIRVKVTNSSGGSQTHNAHLRLSHA